MTKTYNTPVPGKASGDVFTEAMWDDYIVTNVNNMLVPPMCTSLKPSPFTPIVTSVWTQLSMEIATVDTDDMFRALHQIYNTEGFYVVTATVAWAWQTIVTSSRGLGVFLDSSVSTAGKIIESHRDQFGTTIAQIPTAVEGQALVSMASGRHASLWVYQGTGSNSTLYGGTMTSVWVGRP